MIYIHTRAHYADITHIDSRKTGKNLFHRKKNEFIKTTNTTLFLNKIQRKEKQLSRKNRLNNIYQMRRTTE